MYDAAWRKAQNLGTGLAEMELVKKSGEHFCVVASIQRVQEAGETRYFVSNWVDITQRKKAEDQIKYNEAQLRSIMDALAEGVSLIDTSGNMVRINKAEAALFGLSAENENLGIHFRNPHYQHIYTNGKSIPIEESLVSTALKRKRAIRNLEVGVIKDDNSVVWLNVSAVPVVNETGSVVGVVRTSMDITEQKRLRDEREQFTRRLLAVQEEERKRISRELHDDTAQYLALLKLEMDSLVDKERIQNPQTVERLEQLRMTADKALNEVRRFSHELRPSVLEHLGLTPALELIIGEFRNTCPTEVNFNVRGQERRLTDEVELALFRITQEALSNIRKHSGAGTAEVLLKYGPRKIRLTIADNGKGFSITQYEAGSKGSLGLIGMRERAHLIGADLKIKSKPQAGTVIHLELQVQ
jgi:PAS domain S-box-containing protein